jgi:hypothetical protein
MVLTYKEALIIGKIDGSMVPTIMQTICSICEHSLPMSGGTNKDVNRKLLSQIVILQRVEVAS